MQATTFPVYFLSEVATLAFYVGEHLQQTTEFALAAILKNCSS